MSKRIVVYVSESELFELEKRATLAGMTLSQYLKCTGLGQPIRMNNGVIQRAVEYICHLLREVQLLGGKGCEKIIEEACEVCRSLK